MNCKFTIGQRVVCINADPDFHHPYGYSPAIKRNMTIKVGEIYTIRDIEVQNKIDDGIYLYLVEDSASNWYYKRFKPLESTGFEVLKKISISPESFKFESETV